MAVKFGVQGSGQHPGRMPDDTFFRQTARSAEELGYDSLWAGDHISFQNPLLEGVVALSFFAGCTTTITLGAGVLLLPLRHPGLVAKQVASLDVLADGRLIFGAGVGGEGEKDFAAVEVPRAERGSRTDEGIEALRALWTQRDARFQGSFYNFEQIRIDPPPLQPGGPPIWIGGRSERALRRVASRGDGWLAHFASPEGFARGVETIRREAERSGRGDAGITFAMMLPTLIDDDPQRARGDAMVRLSEGYGSSFKEHVIERYCLAGGAAECVDRLGEYIAAGAEHFVFNPMVPPERFQEHIALLAEQVVRPLRV